MADNNNRRWQNKGVNIELTCKCGSHTMQSSMKKWTFFCVNRECGITYTLDVSSVWPEVKA